MKMATGQPMPGAARFCVSLAIVLALMAVIENLLDRHFEQPRELEGERQRRVVFPRFDRIHRLPRDVEPVGEFRLAPVPHRAQHFQLVVHRRLASMSVRRVIRSEEHTSELQSLMRTSYAVFCLKKTT